MAAISLFWDTNMAAVTSCENTLDIEKFESRRARYVVFLVLRSLRVLPGFDRVKKGKNIFFDQIEFGDFI